MVAADLQGGRQFTMLARTGRQHTPLSRPAPREGRYHVLASAINVFAPQQVISRNGFARAAQFIIRNRSNP